MNYHRKSAFDQDLSRIDQNPSCIESCEPRLALSASIAGDLMLQAFGDAIESPDAAEDSSQNHSGISDLTQQATEVREATGLDGSGQTVAVIDSGVAYDHVALGEGFGPGYRVVGGWDFAENDSDPYDDGPAGYHGTHVAGLLAGLDSEHAGVAPGADIVALRVFDDQGLGELSWIESALQWVYANRDSFDDPITTVNLSVGAALNDANQVDAMEMLEDELALLRESDILVFAASGNLYGNNAQPGVLYPASSDSVVSVSSTNDRGFLSDFAQRETGVLASQGESIRSAVPDHVYGWDGKVDDYASLDGTSMATPQVAGASILLRQAMTERGLEPTAHQILELLHDSATTSVDADSGETFHTVNLQAALDLLGGDAQEDWESVNGRLQGTNQAEDVEIDLRDGVDIRINGQSIAVPSLSSQQPFVIDVGGGSDELRILGSDSAERLVLRPDSDLGNSLTTNQFEIELRGFERLRFDGGGGPDRASLYDAETSDTLTSEPGKATLKGIGFEFEVTNVPRVYVHATAGGNDTAFLHDGSGDDQLAVRPRFSSLRSEDHFQLAYGFERVYAYANAGGNDVAELYDSPGDDTLSISEGRSIISGPDYQVSARGFDSTIGHATAGGDDLARIYSTSPDSQWHATSDRVQWTGDDDTVRVARGFERTEAFEQWQPIPIRNQAIELPFDRSMLDDEDAIRRDLEASRAVFEAFGKL